MSFVEVCALSDVPQGRALAGEVGGVEVAIVNTAEGVFAIFNECSHAAVELSEGEVDGCTIECYMHGSRFDLRTGQPLELPATVPVPVYPVRVEEGLIFVDVDNPLTNTDQES